MIHQALNPNANSWSYRETDRLEEAKYIAIQQLKQGHNTFEVQHSFHANLIRYGVYTYDSMWMYLIMSTPSTAFTPEFINGFKRDTDNSADILDEICDVIHR